MRIDKDVFKIPGDGNVYVILEPVPIVIDTGNPHDKERIKEEISKIVSLGRIKAVLLTHMHYDHSGNVDIFPNALIYASQKEINDFKRDPGAFFYFGDFPKVVRKLKNAKALPKEIFGLKVINVGGHTRGSVAFLDEKRHFLFSGDTLFYSGKGRADLPTSAPFMIDESEKLLKRLIIEKKLDLLPGHDY